MKTFTSFANMNKEQLDQLRLNYANLIVDGMDMDSLITFAVETIEQSLNNWTEDEIKGEILDHYGEETLSDLC